MPSLVCHIPIPPLLGLPGRAPEVRQVLGLRPRIALPEQRGSGDGVREARAALVQQEDAELGAGVLHPPLLIHGPGRLKSRATCPNIS